MECGTCGSQDTKPVQGISKKTGKPWKAYDCNEPSCKSEKGYASRTFVPMPRAKGSSPVIATGTLEKKVDQILAILKANFKEEKIPFNNSPGHDEESPF